MDAQNRSITSRPFALAAMFLIAGVLVLRAIAVFSAPAKTDPVGSVDEQQLARLIEAFVGADKVRTSVQRASDGQRIWLVLIDGPVSENTPNTLYRETIQTLIEARGFNVEEDQLQILQQPFAQTPLNALTPLQIAELSALGLAFLFLLIGSIPNRTVAKTDNQQKTKHLHLTSLEASPLADTDPSLQQAAAIASITPERSAALIRRWMREDNR